MKAICCLLGVWRTATSLQFYMGGWAISGHDFEEKEIGQGHGQVLRCTRCGEESVGR